MNAHSFEQLYVDWLYMYYLSLSDSILQERQCLHLSSPSHGAAIPPSRTHPRYFPESGQQSFNASNPSTHGLCV